jgi:3-deoxy-manno-octulosonate cytidylyltransferase (CMP-KDO synthetase)
VTTAGIRNQLLVVIPARFASSRFPGKPLADLNGKSVLRRCHEQVRQVVDVDSILVATDDARIADECRRHGMRFEMTSTACITGTDRVAEIAERNHADWYVNVQGDEPFLDPSGLSRVIDATRVAPQEIQVINAQATIQTELDFRSGTIPKMVTTVDGHLLYVSRGAIPTTKSLEFSVGHRQVGLYAFRREALAAFAAHGRKTPLESIEDIEILRFLELGFKVTVLEVPAGGVAIDTPEDLERARRFLLKGD